MPVLALSDSPRGVLGSSPSYRHPPPEPQTQPPQGAGPGLPRPPGPPRQSEANADLKCPSPASEPLGRCPSHAEVQSRLRRVDEAPAPGSGLTPPPLPPFLAGSPRPGAARAQRSEALPGLLGPQPRLQRPPQPHLPRRMPKQLRYGWVRSAVGTNRTWAQAQLFGLTSTSAAGAQPLWHPGPGISRHRVPGSRV